MKTILDADQIESLLSKMDSLEKQLIKDRKISDPFLDNDEFLTFMNISKRTAQTWRDDGIISFSQVGSKIYYRMSDVQKLLDTHRHERKIPPPRI